MSDGALTQWSRLLLTSLADAGIEHVVVSPGARSTPFTHAALACGRFECESIVDERSAAFVAVGRAKVTGRPSLLICTSGSAAANYFPAIVEASVARVPLLILTADRPPELMACSAPQTIDQVKLYGDYVRHFDELGLPDTTDRALSGLRRKAAQAVAMTQGEQSGPVHLNARARKPLEPTPANGDLETRVTALLDKPITRRSRAIRSPSADDVRLVAQQCRRARSGLIVCGPGSISAAPSSAIVRELVLRTGFSFYPEATSQLRFSTLIAPAANADALDLVLRSDLAMNGLRVDTVIQIGEPPISGNLERFLHAHPPRLRIVLADAGWPDPAGTADHIVVGDLNQTLTAVVDALGSDASPRRPSWLAQACSAVWNAVASECDERTRLSEGQALRLVCASLDRGSLLAVGNSLPVRHLDRFCPAGDRGVFVWSQRGASGIDGVVSGALGAASAWPGPTTLVVGDVSFLHDIGALLTAKRVRRSLAIVVLNNDGGRIFDQLPIARTEGMSHETFEFWRTSHGLTFERICEGYGLDYARAGTATALSRALTDARARSRARVIEVELHAGDEQRELEGVHEKLAGELKTILSAAESPP